MELYNQFFYVYVYTVIISFPLFDSILFFALFTAELLSTSDDFRVTQKNTDAKNANIPTITTMSLCPLSTIFVL